MPSELVKVIDAAWIESTIGNAESDITFRLFHDCKVRGPQVESTLLSCLAKLRDSGHKVKVDLPEASLSRGDIESLLEVPRKRNPSAAERVFVDRVAGVLLCHFAELQGARDPVEETLRDALESDADGTFGNGSHRAAIWLFDGLATHEPLLKVAPTHGQPKSVNPFAPTHRRVAPLLSRLYRDVTGGVFAAAVGRAALKRVESFAMQAIENAYEHATTDLDSQPLKTASLLQLRRVDSLETEIARNGVWSDALQGYFNRLPNSTGKFCEIQIADGGPGIAARMTSAAHGMSREDEKVALGQAFRPTGTTKDEGAARGLGLPKLFAAAAMTEGLVLIRSGHWALAADFIQEKRKDALLSGLGCGVRDESIWESLESEMFELGRIAGTQVSLLVPDRSNG